MRAAAAPISELKKCTAPFGNLTKISVSSPSACRRGQEHADLVLVLIYEEELDHAVVQDCPSPIANGKRHRPPHDLRIEP